MECLTRKTPKDVVPNINDMIAKLGIIQSDVNLSSKINELEEPNCFFLPKFENQIYKSLWKEYYQDKIKKAKFSKKATCRTFYSLNSFSHEKINFVCEDCFNVARYVWYNTIPNAFSVEHLYHSERVITCDKCFGLCETTKTTTFTLCFNRLDCSNWPLSRNFSVNNSVNKPIFIST
jgi:hypothetical protein